MKFLRSFAPITTIALIISLLGAGAPAQADHKRHVNDAAAMVLLFGTMAAIIASQKGHGHHHQKVVVPKQKKVYKQSHHVQQAKKSGLRCADSKLHQMDNNFAPHGGGEHWHKKKGPNRHSHGMCY